MYRRNPLFQTQSIAIIVGTCLLLLLLSTFSYRLYDLLAMTPAELAREPWTILTSIFMHGGWWHLFYNMFMLFFLGTYLTQFVGERKMLFTFLVGGLLGNVLFLLVALYTPLGHPMSSVVGASGGVFALGGALAVLTPRTRVLLFYFIPMPLWAAILIMFALSFSAGNIAWEGHLGGLLLGLAAGYYFKRRLRRDYWW